MPYCIASVVCFHSQVGWFSYTCKAREISKYSSVKLTFSVKNDRPRNSLEIRFQNISGCLIITNIPAAYLFRPGLVTTGKPDADDTIQLLNRVSCIRSAKLQVVT